MAGLQSLKDEINAKLAQTDELKKLEELRIEYLGRKGKMAELFKSIAEIPASERRQYGQSLNELKQFSEQAFSEKQKVLLAGGKRADVSFDATLPGIQPCLGKL